jgi:hypothetical protein
MEPISLFREQPTIVVESRPIPEEDRALLMSIVEPTYALQEQAEQIPVGAGIVLNVPIGSPGFVTPKHAPTRFTCISPPSLKRPLGELEEESPPPCCESLAPRFDLVLREGTASDLQRIAEDLGELHFGHPNDKQLQEELKAMVSKMATDLSADSDPDLNKLLPLTRSLRKAVVLMTDSARGDVLRDTLCVFSGHAHELSGSKTPQANPPTQLQLLLARRRLTSSGVVPVSPSAATHGKFRRTQAFTEPQLSGGPLNEPLTSMLELLVNAEAPDLFAPDEALLSIGRAFLSIADSVVDMGRKIPGLTAAASTLIPRLAKFKEYIMRMPPGLTEQAVHHLQTLAEEAQAEALDEKINPVCFNTIHQMDLAVDRMGGALGLLGDACVRLAASDPTRKEVKRLAEEELAELWKGLLWMGDAMTPVVDTVDVIHKSLRSLDMCISHLEKNLPPHEVIQLLGTMMEDSMEATRRVSGLVKPNRGPLLSRLMDSVAHATELASDARASVDASVREQSA